MTRNDVTLAVCALITQGLAVFSIMVVKSVEVSITGNDNGNLIILYADSSQRDEHIRCSKQCHALISQQDVIFPHIQFVYVMMQDHI